MPTIEQIRAARALLGWSQADLAERADLSQTGIARIENGTNKPNSSTLEKIQNAFDVADIEFIGMTGVKIRTGEVKTLRGKSGLIEFMDDTYEVARTIGGKMFFYNILPENWLEWLGEDWWKAHAERMASVKDNIDVRIIIPEGNKSFISNTYAQYKWFPQDQTFNENKSLYAYGNKLGFVNFLKDDVEIVVLNSSEFSQGIQILFDIAWNNVAKKIEQ